MYTLTFIAENDFQELVANTLKKYNDSLKPIDLIGFNSNIIDPIKLLFDKSTLRKSFDDIINLELNRQRDKSNNNVIGYFHQNVFKYIKNCILPKEGWDVIVTLSEYKIYAITTGIDDAFYQMCLQLPITINELITEKEEPMILKDTALEGLYQKHPDVLTALYLLAFINI